MTYLICDVLKYYLKDRSQIYYLMRNPSAVSFLQNLHSFRQCPTLNSVWLWLWSIEIACLSITQLMMSRYLYPCQR